MTQDPDDNPALRGIFKQAASKGKRLAEDAFLAATEIGEAKLKEGPHWQFYQRTKSHLEYRDAELSVKSAWKRFCEVSFGPTANTPKGPETGFNKMLLLSRLRESTTFEQKAQALTIFSPTITDAAESGNADFFLDLAAGLKSRGPAKKADKQEFAFRMILNWLTGFLWLMDNKTAALEVGKLVEIQPKTQKEMENLVAHFENAKKTSEWNLYSAEERGIIGVNPDGSFRFAAGFRID